MRRFILVLVAAAALAAPGSALAGGVVLKFEHGSHLAAVVHAKRVSLVHTTASLKVGQRIALSERRLANGTFAATHVRVLGRAKHVEFRAFVLSHRQDRVTVSAGGAPVTVQTTAPATPGSEVDVDADVNDNGQLQATQVTTTAPTAPGGSIEGHVFALGTGSITIASEHQLLVLKVGAGVDVSKLQVGDEVLANFSQLSDGSLVMTSISADNAAAAGDDDNNNDNNNNDNNGDNHGSGGGDNGGGGGDD
jgi:hypothetical protein